MVASETISKRWAGRLESDSQELRGSVSAWSERRVGFHSGALHASLHGQKRKLLASVRLLAQRQRRARARWVFCRSSD